MVAVVNDTVGTMMTCGYEDPLCEVGLIVGESQSLLDVPSGPQAQAVTDQQRSPIYFNEFPLTYLPTH